MKSYCFTLTKTSRTRKNQGTPLRRLKSVSCKSWRDPGSPAEFSRWTRDTDYENTSLICNTHGSPGVPKAVSDLPKYKAAESKWWQRTRGLRTGPYVTQVPGSWSVCSCHLLQLHPEGGLVTDDFFLLFVTSVSSLREMLCRAHQLAFQNGMCHSFAGRVQ